MIQIQTRPIIYPINATLKELLYTVTTGGNIASINADGLLTVTADGMVVVTATAKDGTAIKSNPLIIDISGNLTIIKYNYIINGDFVDPVIDIFGSNRYSWKYWDLRAYYDPDQHIQPVVINQVLNTYPYNAELIEGYFAPWAYNITEENMLAHNNMALTFSFDAWTDGPDITSMALMQDLANGYVSLGYSNAPEAANPTTGDIPYRSEWHFVVTSAVTHYEFNVTMDRIHETSGETWNESVQTVQFQLATTNQTIYIDNVALWTRFPEVIDGGSAVANIFATPIDGGSSTFVSNYVIDGRW